MDLQGSTPRFLVTESPRFGRFVLSSNVDQFVEFFTYNDIVNNGLSYVPNRTDVMILDFAELELNADEIQPARFRFELSIRKFNFFANIFIWHAFLYLTNSKKSEKLAFV